MKKYYKMLVYKQNIRKDVYYYNSLLKALLEFSKESKNTNNSLIILEENSNYYEFIAAARNFSGRVLVDTPKTIENLLKGDN